MKKLTLGRYRVPKFGQTKKRNERNLFENHHYNEFLQILDYSAKF